MPIWATWQSPESLFMRFFIIVFNLEDLRPDAKFKNKAIKSIAKYMYNYPVYKL